MTPWLWIIGIIAVIWPVALMFYLDYDVMTKLTKYQSFGMAYTNASSKRLREEITQLQSIIEQQDRLIALLWYKEFGEQQPETPYASVVDLVSFCDQGPNWHAIARQHPAVFDTLCKFETYPWGARAEDIHMSS